MRGRGDSGTSAIEFVIVAPVFLALIFLLVQAGLFFYGRNVAETAAREGVSYLRLAGNNADPDAFEPEAERVAIIYAERIGSLKGPTAEASIDEANGRVSVVVTGTIASPGGTVEIRREATATLEQFRGDQVIA
ncbi:MAG: TadE/TadG family type IV pilus assembly protein [Nocardioidaceae bacterium]|nr:TadE/TadG family type IV pilus assembly protein [Nocardioidaceae bacterium]